MSAAAVRTAPPGRFARWRNGWSVAARLAVGGFRATPGRATFTVVVLAIGVALMTVHHDRPSVETTLMTLGVTVVTVTWRSARPGSPIPHRAPHVGDARTGRCPPVPPAPDRRGRGVGISAVMAVGLGIVVGVLASQFVGHAGYQWLAPALIGSIVPIAVAALVGGRDDGSLLPASNTRAAPGSPAPSAFSVRAFSCSAGSRSPRRLNRGSTSTSRWSPASS